MLFNPFCSPERTRPIRTRNSAGSTSRTAWSNWSLRKASPHWFSCCSVLTVFICDCPYKWYFMIRSYYSTIHVVQYKSTRIFIGFELHSIRTRRRLRSEEGVDHRERPGAWELVACGAADAAPVAHLSGRPAVPRGARVSSDRWGLQEARPHAHRLEARFVTCRTSNYQKSLNHPTIRFNINNCSVAQSRLSNASKCTVSFCVCNICIALFMWPTLFFNQGWCPLALAQGPKLWSR